MDGFPIARTGRVLQLNLVLAVVVSLPAGAVEVMQPAPLALAAPAALAMCGALAVVFLVVRVIQDLRREPWRREFAREGAWHARIAELDRLQARKRWFGFGVCTAVALAGVLVFACAPVPEVTGEGSDFTRPLHWWAMKLFGGALLVAGLCGQALLLAVSPEEPQDYEPPIMLNNQPLTVEQAHDLVGAEGVVLSALRPQGKLMLDGQTYVVKSEGLHVDEGTPVRVDRIDGPNIVVVPVREVG